VSHTPGTPSNSKEFNCLIPCQWMAVPLCPRLLVTWMTRLSPQSAMIAGPGIVPLKVNV
jgi:hypothetical protein